MDVALGTAPQDLIVLEGMIASVLSKTHVLIKAGPRGCLKNSDTGGCSIGPSKRRRGV
jgi:hypothetical protein